jgi:DNA polymerase-3 subunit beta
MNAIAHFNRAAAAAGLTVIHGGIAPTVEAAANDDIADVLPDNTELPPSPVIAPDDIAALDDEDREAIAVELADKLARRAESSFIVGRAAIGKVMTALARTVEKRNTVPILSNVLLQAAGGILVATATDLDKQLSAMVECGPGDFSATLPAHLLADIFKKGADSDEVGFRMDGDDVAKVFWGSLSYRLPALPVSDFPSLAPGDLPHRFAIGGAAFRGMLESTSRAVSKEETRYYLNGVFLHVKDNRRWEWDAETQGMICTGGGNMPSELRTIATDGHRLYVCDAPLPEGLPEDMRGVILPRGTVELFLKLTAGKACPDSVTVEVSDTKARLSFGEFELVTKLIDGTFPDYQRVMPTGNDKVGTFHAGKLVDALDSVTLIASERDRAVKFLVEADKVTLTVNNPDAGTATMEMPATLAMAGEASPSIEIGFNGSYLKTMMKDLADDGGEITVEFADAGSPTIFRSGREGFMAVLMPMRV